MVTIPTFSPPTVNDRPLAGGETPGDRRFWGYFGLQPTGQTVIRESGVWSSVTYPAQARLEAADSIRDADGNIAPGYFLGGHVYEISSVVAAELVTAGYEVT